MQHGTMSFRRCLIIAQIAPAAAFVAQWQQTCMDVPPLQKRGNFILDRVMEAVMSGSKQSESEGVTDALMYFRTGD